jgi:hypothetical protein
MVEKYHFAVDDDDHCETPGEAYDDITAALGWLAERQGTPRHELRIYDPYFCDGAVVRNLATRGFPRVYNKNEDFYAAIASGSTPDYDALVTNPPYSSTHIEQILRFCVASGKPWFLLVPNYVYVNPYYAKATAGVKPFYLVTKTRYWYTAPTGARGESAQRTSPFLSFWYADMSVPEENAAFVRDWRAEEKQQQLSSSGGDRPLLAIKLSQLPHGMRAQYDPTRRRLRKKQREAGERRKRKREEEREAEARRQKALQPCRFGTACTRPGCWFMHPA